MADSDETTQEAGGPRSAWIVQLVNAAIHADVEKLRGLAPPIREHDTAGEPLLALIRAWYEADVARNDGKGGGAVPEVLLAIAVAVARDSLRLIKAKTSPDLNEALTQHSAPGVALVETMSIEAEVFLRAIHTNMMRPKVSLDTADAPDSPTDDIDSQTIFEGERGPDALALHRAMYLRHVLAAATDQIVNGDAADKAAVREDVGRMWSACFPAVKEKWHAVLESVAQAATEVAEFGDLCPARLDLVIKHPDWGANIDHELFMSAVRAWNTSGGDPRRSKWRPILDILRAIGAADADDAESDVKTYWKNHVRTR